MNKGFTTIEVIIAMTIMVIILSSVVLISFGNQMSLAGSETAAEALKRAQALVERQQALARKDFNLVNATSSSDGFYTNTISVDLYPDFLTKEVTVEVGWENERGLEQSVELKTIVTDFSSSAGGSTCNSSLSGDWTDPEIVTYELSGTGLLPVSESGIYPVTDIDAYRGRLYVTVERTSANINKTFFVFDISNQLSTPSYLGGVDNAPTTVDGFNAVHVVEKEGARYAFLANAHDSDFNDCSEGRSCSQLQVVDVSSPSFTWDPPIAGLKLATSTGPMVNGSGGQAVGKSIFYKDGYVYLGLSRTSSGPEFQVINVYDPLTPVWMGSWPSPGTSSLQPINALQVRGGYAYLVHPTNSQPEQLTVLNVVDPRNPVRVSGFHAGDNAKNGKSLSLVGDKLYLGRTDNITSANPEFHILNISNPTAVVPAALGDRVIDDSINDLLVRSNLSFLLTNDSLEILRTDDPSDIVPHASIPMPFGSEGRTLDCEGNYLYVGSVDASNNGYITVITGGP